MRISDWSSDVCSSDVRQLSQGSGFTIPQELAERRAGRRGLITYALVQQYFANGCRQTGQPCAVLPFSDRRPTEHELRRDPVHVLSEFGVGVARIQSNPFATDRGRGEKGDEEIRPGDGQCGDPITTLCASGDKSARTVVDRVLEHRISQTRRSEEHTSELQSLMRISYAVFCLTKKTITLQT